MSAPIIHAKNSAKKFGGKPEDYLDIHQLMDSSKASFSDARHRTITHNIWFCVNIIPKIFGEERKNSDGNFYCPKDVAEMHCIEDIGSVPTIQDYLENMTLEKWMQGNANVEKPKLNKPDPKKVPIEDLKFPTSREDAFSRRPQSLPNDFMHMKLD